MPFGKGGYRYLPAVFQYSSGVAAEPGFELERVRLLRPLPLAAGFAFVERHLSALGRPAASFAACELRSAAPFSDQGFEEFNREYVKTLERWGIFEDGRNPVARTNVCPVHGRPSEPVLHAFSYTVPASGLRRGGFIVAGGAEVRAGTGSFEARTVRRGETSPDALRDKARHVIAEMERRLSVLGFSWQDAASVQAYTVHDIGALVGPEFAARGIAALSWHYARPPVTGLEFEMDVRGAAREIAL